MHIKSSKTGPNPSVFDTFDLEMGFGLLRPALLDIEGPSDRQKMVRICSVLRTYFRHWKVQSGPNTRYFDDFYFEKSFQKTSEYRVCCHFLFGNLLNATPAYTVPISHFSKNVPTYFDIFISKCASPHNGVYSFHSSTPKSGSDLI